MDSESASLRYYVHQFSDKTDNRGRNLKNLNMGSESLGSESQKSKLGFGINTSNIPCVPVFSQKGQLLIFLPKFGELPRYLQYFGSNIVEDVAESWVEAEMSWVEVGGG